MGDFPTWRVSASLLHPTSGELARGGVTAYLLDLPPGQARRRHGPEPAYEEMEVGCERSRAEGPPPAPCDAHAMAKMPL